MMRGLSSFTQLNQTQAWVETFDKHSALKTFPQKYVFNFQRKTGSISLFRSWVVRKWKSFFSLAASGYSTRQHAPYLIKLTKKWISWHVIYTPSWSEHSRSVSQHVNWKLFKFNKICNTLKFKFLAGLAILAARLLFYFVTLL